MDRLLIRAWANRLDRELELLDDALGESVERHVERKYIGPTNWMGSVSDTDRQNEANWQSGAGAPICLDGLYDLLAELERADKELGEGLTSD